MKRILCIILAAVMTLSLTACGGPKPVEVTEEMLSAISLQDEETIEEDYEGEVEETEIDWGSLIEDLELSEEQQDLLSALNEKIFDFEYEIGEETIEKNHADVKVTFTTYDFESLGENLKTSIEEKVAEGVKDETITRDNMDTRVTEIVFECLKEELDKLTEKTRTKETTLSYEKTEDGWKMMELSEEALDAMYGGAILVMQQLDEETNVEDTSETEQGNETDAAEE